MGLGLTNFALEGVVVEVTKKRGWLSVFWERGSPDLPACGLWRGSSNGPVRPTFTNSSSRPTQGTKPRGADDRKASSGVASSGWLARRRRDQGRGTL